MGFDSPPVNSKPPRSTEQIISGVPSEGQPGLMHLTHTRTNVEGLSMVHIATVSKHRGPCAAELLASSLRAHTATVGIRRFFSNMFKHPSQNNDYSFCSLFFYFFFSLISIYPFAVVSCCLKCSDVFNFFPSVNEQHKTSEKLPLDAIAVPKICQIAFNVRFCLFI